MTGRTAVGRPGTPPAPRRPRTGTRTMFRFPRRAVRPLRPATGTRLSLESLEDRTVPDAAFAGLADSLDAQLGAVQRQLAAVEATSTTALPIMNRSVRDVAASVDTALSTFRSALKSGLAGLVSTQD